VGFDYKVSKFFSNYLVNRKTKYLWNNFSSPFYNIDTGVGQGLALSPISFLSFIDDGLFISQNKSLSISNINLITNKILTGYDTGAE